MIRAVLFDVGGPIDMEVAAEAALDTDMRAGLAREGLEVADEAWEAANRDAVESFAPNLYRAVIWRLTRGDRAISERVYRWVEERAHGRDLFELRPGIVEVLDALEKRGLRLGLAANQPTEALARLERHGLARYFANQGIAGVYGVRKPDVRLFLRACEELGVAPEECVMVGDRIDNDVAPAKLLGMRAVRVRTGRHAGQEPRSWDEAPDAEARDAAGMRAAIEGLLE